MNLKKIFAGLIIFISIQTFAFISPQREAHETFRSARNRHLIQRILEAKPTGHRGHSAWDLAGQLEKIDMSQVSDLGSVERLNQIFQYIHETKFITHLNQPLPDRRLSWMYPDDGCFIRAEMAAHFTSVQKLPEPSKIFSFGELAVRSNNHPSGVVRWWYHVVPVYRVGNQAYAIDPSIDPRGPMTVQAWKKSMENDGLVDSFAICKPHTIGPEDDCATSDEVPFQDILKFQVGYLNQEWNRLIELGRNPEVELK